MITLAEKLKMMTSKSAKPSDVLYELKGEKIFNGAVSSVIDSGFKSNNLDLTIEWWGMSFSMPTISSQHAFFGEVDQSNNSYGMLFLIHSSSQYICSSFNRGNNNTQMTGNVVAYDINKYHHFVVTREVGGRMRLYINGRLVNTSTTNVAEYMSSSFTMKIGGNTDFKGTSSRILSGKIKDFKITKGILSQSQILDIYNQG